MTNKFDISVYVVYLCVCFLLDVPLNKSPDTFHNGSGKGPI